MRFVYFVIFAVIVGALVLFAIQNNESVTLRLLNMGVTIPLWAVAVVVYLLGMVSGWTVVGLLKRTVQGVTERREK